MSLEFGIKAIHSLILDRQEEKTPQNNKKPTTK